MKYRIRPGKTESKFAFFIGIVFIIFGVGILAFMLVNGNSFIAIPFGIIWITIAVFNTYRAYKNGFTKEGMPMYEVDKSSVDRQGNMDFEEKLRKVEKLYNEGLISQEEYSKKRNEIIDSKW